MKNKNKKLSVYVGICGDIVHHGHINILKKASNYGEVILGVLTDNAIKSYKKYPILNYKNRKTVLESIKFVKKVVPQKTLDYSFNLKKFKPDIVIHGNDWKNGIQQEIRSRVIEVLKGWNGKLIEPKYTKNISSSLIKKKILKNNGTYKKR